LPQSRLLYIKRNRRMSRKYLLFLPEIPYSEIMSEGQILVWKMPKSKKNNKSVLVVGGGIAGLTAASELAQMGIRVLLVEREAFVGGHSAMLTCKATYRCLKCNKCLVEQCLKGIFDDNLFDIRVRTAIRDIVMRENFFRVSLESLPQFIDPGRCTDCGLCLEKCPEREIGAILRAPCHHIHPFYAIDSSKCSCDKLSGVAICESVCPDRAINLDQKGESWSIDVDGLVLATGFQAFDPKVIGKYKFGSFRDMVTAMELQEILRLNGQIVRVSNGLPPKNVAFVQCVGSRDATLNHEFCSRVCCGYALRMGLRIVHDNPEIMVTVFYMDIQNLGKDFNDYYPEARARMRLLRGLPGDFYPSDDDHICVSYYDKKHQKTLTEDFDMLVLSVGLMPPDSQSFIQERLKLDINDDGFLRVPDKMRNKGIVIAGALEGPMDVAESIIHAKGAALELGQYLEVDQNTG